MTYTKKQLVRGLRGQLFTDRNKARRALLFLYDRQTIEEQSKMETVEDNKIGFTAPDAEILSGIARFLRKNGFLTTAQERIVRRRIGKYAGQLLNSSIERGLIVRRSRQRWEILDKPVQAVL